MGAVLRADLSDADSDAVDTRTPGGAGGRVGPEIAIAVIVDADGAACRMCADDYRDLAARAGGRARAVGGSSCSPRHVVDMVAAGGRWYCADGCGSAGVVEDPTASPVGGRPRCSTAAGSMPGARSSSRWSTSVDPERAAALARVIEQRRRDRRRGVRMRRRARDIEHALACAGQVGTRSARSPTSELARLALALTDPRVRDTLYALAVGDDAGRGRVAVGRAGAPLPEPWRVEALVLLAFSAYARGDGPLAGISLDAALRCEPRTSDGRHARQALQSGMRPEQIRELALTGYRLADGSACGCRRGGRSAAAGSAV